MLIDRRYRPQARASVLGVEVDGEVVLYDTARGSFHGLNGTAAILWSCCDGSATVDELVAELADAFGAPEADVRLGIDAALDRFVEEGLLVAEGEESVAPTGRFPSPADLGPACAPCLAKLDGVGWVGSVAVRLGELRTGVRATSDDGLGVLARLLDDHVVDDPDAPRHYSVALPASEAGARGARELSRLFYGHRLLVRSRGRGRVLRALVAQLDGHLDVSRCDRLMVGGRLVVRDGGAVLVTHGLGPDLDAAEPRLRRWGITVADAPSVELAEPGEIVLHRPGLAIDEALLAGLEAEQDGGDPAQPAPGAWRLRGWLAPGFPESASLARPDAFGVVVATTRNLEAVGAPAALDRIAGHLAEAPVRAIAAGDPARLAAEIRVLLGQG